MAAALLGMAAFGHARSNQQTVGDFYGLGSDNYFDEARPAPTPEPAAEQQPTQVAGGSQVKGAAPVTQAAQVSRVTPQAPAQAGPTSSPAAAVAGAPYTYPKGDLAKAKADAKALAIPARSNAANLPTNTDLASTIPGYTTATQPGEAYADDPDALSAAGASAASNNEAWRMVTDPKRTVVHLAPGELARAQDIEKNPNSYLGGESVAAADGSCKPLPPSGTTDYYEATCNKGAQVIETPQSCSGRMDTTVVNTLRYFYYAVAPNQTAFGFASSVVMDAKVSAGICRVEPVSTPICDAQVEMGAGGTDVNAYLKYCRKSVRGNAQQYSCSSEIAQSEIPDHVNFKTGTVYLKTEGSRSVTVTRNEGTCPTLVADTTCTALGAEVCSEGPETRIIDGVPVTQSCLAWQRQFTCQRITQASDCADLESNPKCTYARDECLDDPQTGPCQVSTKVYKCTLPAAPTNDAKQYICGDDVYCINGDCEPIERQASTEFKDAVVGLHVLGQANAEFNPDTLTLFSGTREACSAKIFGASNCCSGKGVPLLTPFLCNAAERQLDVKDDKGLCHKLGSYCAAKILGICVTSKTAYCCFESKLSRILQEQGRPQIGKPWAAPKTETCKGFSLDEFSRLDLSVMDFTEVYAEFTDAAKLPSEVETSKQIQERIKAYYDSHRKP
ncbi:MAG: conjugal transfer protein TraN [Pseudomonadota bacterium]|nr:conjugal transfer protein TraN [Pseudomonadota bacterium]